MTDDTMIERLARAAVAQLNAKAPDYFVQQAHMEIAVRAVLAELREPTPEMIAAGMKHEGTDLASEYTAMLDHILSQ